MKKPEKKIVDKERRAVNVRRDLNDMVRDPFGRVTEAKVWANVGKCIAAYLLVVYSDTIIAKWDTLTILLTILVLPDLAKKVIEMKWGQHTTVAKP